MRAADPMLRKELEVARDMTKLQENLLSSKKIKKLMRMVVNGDKK
jgi:hypothetical protein